MSGPGIRGRMHDAGALLPRLAAVAAGGAALALTVPAPGVCVLGWVAAVLLLVAAARAGSWKRAAVLGWAFGAAFGAAHLFWIYLTCRFAAIAVPVAATAWLGLAGLTALPWAAFGGLARLAAGGSGGPGRAWPWACACLWAGIEFALSGTDIALFKLGYTQWRSLALIQGSSWAGPHALGWLVMLVNGLLAACWLRLTEAGRGVESRIEAGGDAGGSGSGVAADHGSPELVEPRGSPGIRASLALAARRLMPLAPSAAAAGALLAGWWLYGSMALARAGPAGGPDWKRVAIIQPNVDQYAKEDPGLAAAIRSGMDELLARAAAARPALVVWPETSVPGWLDEPENMSWASGWARRMAAQQVVGALTYDAAPRNSMVVLEADGRRGSSYHKRHLVPFGEFVPLRSWLAPFVGIFAGGQDLEPGEARQAPLKTALGYAGATVCYETAFPRLVRRAAARAEFLINVTNDGWYKDTWGPRQHFYANTYRAVENRVYVVRAGNTGISGVIDPWGRVIASLDLGRRGALAAGLPPEDPFPGRSLYTRLGDWFGWLTACLGLAFLLQARYTELMGRRP